MAETYDNKAILGDQLEALMKDVAKDIAYKGPDATDGKWIGMKRPAPDLSINELKYWKLCSFTISSRYWTLQFEADVTNATYDPNTYETKIVHIGSYAENRSVSFANEVRDFHGALNSTRGYGNIIYYTQSGSSVTVYIRSKRSNNTTQFCRLNKVMVASNISGLTWYSVDTPPDQPSSPTQFTAIIDKFDPSRVMTSSSSSSWSGDNTNVPTCAAVEAKISSALSGNLGGFLGSFLVYTINTNISRGLQFENGDWFVVLDAGTITYKKNNTGTTQSLPVQANDEVFWTSSGFLEIRTNNSVKLYDVSTLSTWDSLTVPGLYQVDVNNATNAPSSGKHMCLVANINGEVRQVASNGINIYYRGKGATTSFSAWKNVDDVSHATSADTATSATSADTALSLASSAMDQVPVQGSSKAVMSGGMYNALTSLWDAIARYWLYATSAGSTLYDSHTGTIVWNSTDYPMSFTGGNSLTLQHLLYNVLLSQGKCTPNITIRATCSAETTLILRHHATGTKDYSNQSFINNSPTLLTVINNGTASIKLRLQVGGRIDKSGRDYFDCWNVVQDGQEDIGGDPALIDNNHIHWHDIGTVSKNTSKTWEIIRRSDYVNPGTHIGTVHFIINSR